MPAAPPPTRTNTSHITFHVATMDCAVEEAQIRRALDDVPGIRSLRFRLTERQLEIDADESILPVAVAAIRRAGFEPVPITTEVRVAGRDPSVFADRETLRLAASLALALAAEAISYFVPGDGSRDVAQAALAVAAIALGGLSAYRKGIAALRRGLLNINALMTVAVTGAFLIGRWPEAAMVMALYGIAEAIEARAVDRARNAIQRLMALAPEEVEVAVADEGWARVAAAGVSVGTRARVRPGERLALDGIVLAGRSAVDQAPVTGESMPVDKAPGDLVFAGTINQTGALEFQVTARASESTLARIIRAVEQAQSRRAPTQRFVDRFAARYTPAVFLLAVAIASLAPLALGWAWSRAIYSALVLLVIACPCALVIATPVTVVSGLASAARRGILVKGGLYLEQARNLKAVAFDKTGTITAGAPRLVAFESLSSTVDHASVTRAAASLAARSDHPVSVAIANALDGPREEVQAFEAMPGRGVRGVIDGRAFVLANHRWIEARGLCTPALEARLAPHEHAGRTTVLLADDHEVLALMAVADTVKPSADVAMRALKALGIRPVMLTGDNAATAGAVAAAAGIEDVRSGLLPEQKLQAIEDLQTRYGATAMVGDGINDAPALAKADVGIAMGAAGTHIAIEAADVVIMNDELTRVPEAIERSRRMHAVLWQNVAIALSIKAAFLLLAVLDRASMWMAVFADMGASLLVVFNGLRLLRMGRERS